MKFPQNLSNLYLPFFILILLGNFFETKAYDEKNKIGFFDNKPLQEILDKPFYLFGENKDNAIPFYLKDFVDWDFQMIYDYGYHSEIEDPFFSYKDNFTENAYLELTQVYENKISYRKNSTLYIKEAATKEFLETISTKINREPVNAKFKMEEDNQLTILEQSQKGLELSIDESYQKIRENLSTNLQTSYIPLVVSEKEPAISSENPEKYQIKTLIGTGESDFTGSTKTRIHNIKTAAKKFDGIIIAPEEEFSFTTILGEVEEKTGYKEEMVIKKNQTVPEYGGGICQVSTTMFRGALNAGFEITERHNHSFPVHYYDPPGTDATIYVPKPDLRIKNTTENYLLIQTRIDEANRKFYIDFFSKEDLFDVELIGPEVVEKTSDGKLRTTLKQIVKDKEGKEVFQDVFKSFYDNPANYPSPSQIIISKPKGWSSRQWDEYYAKFGAMIEELKKNQ